MPTTTNQHTLVAAFNSETQAQSAVGELERSGFNRSDIQTHSGTTAAGGATTTARTGTEHHGGFTGWLKSLFESDDAEGARYDEAYRGGNTIVSVTTSDDRIDQAAEILDRFQPVNVQEQQQPAASAASASGASLGSSAATGRSAEAVSERSRSPRESASAVPVIQEDIAVGKRTYQRGGVRVYSRVIEEPVEENVRLRGERVFVNREPADRPVTEADLRAGAEQVIEVQELAEEPVIEKRARVVEEVRVGKDVSERNETVHDTVRRTEVDVESLDKRVTQRGAAGSVDDAPFRDDFNRNYAAQGASYNTYEPAYQYGYDAASDPRYRGRSFDQVEQDLRTDYEGRYPNGTWDKMKDAIRHGWDRVTGKA